MIQSFQLSEVYEICYRVSIYQVTIKNRKKTADPYLQKKKEIKRLGHVRCQQRVKIKRKTKIVEEDRQRKNRKICRDFV